MRIKWSQLLRSFAEPESRALLGSAAVSVWVRVAGIGLSYGANILLSRMMGLRGYGLYVIALSWALVLVVPARMGLENSALRFSTIYLERGDSAALSGFVRLSAISVGVASLVLGAALAIGGVAYSDAQRTTFLWAGLLILPMALLTIFSVVMRTGNKIFESQIYDQVLRPFVLIALIGIAAASNVRVTANTGMALTMIAAVAALVALVVSFKRSFPVFAHISPDYSKRREWLSLSLPLLVMAIVQELMNQIDVILLGIFSTSQQAGLFAAAWRLASLVPFVLVGLAVVAGPKVASAHDRGAEDELQRIARLIAKVGFGFAVMAAILIIVAGRGLLSIFGDGFVAAYPALVILLCGGVINAFTGIVAYLAILTGRQMIALSIFAVALIVSVALNLLMIPRMGALGAAIASTTALIVWNVAMLVYVRRATGIDSAALRLGAFWGHRR